MKLSALLKGAAFSMIFTLAACGTSPTAPEEPADEFASEPFALWANSCTQDSFKQTTRMTVLVSWSDLERNAAARNNDFSLALDDFSTAANGIFDSYTDKIIAKYKSTDLVNSAGEVNQDFVNEMLAQQGQILRDIESQSGITVKDPTLALFGAARPGCVPG